MTILDLIATLAFIVSLVMLVVELFLYSNETKPDD